MKNSESAKQYSAVVKAFLNTNLYGLLTLPSGDNNFTTHLLAATAEELSTAISIMTAFPEGNKSRLDACQRQFNTLMA